MLISPMSSHARCWNNGLKKSQFSLCPPAEALVCDLFSVCFQKLAIRCPSNCRGTELRWMPMDPFVTLFMSIPLDKTMARKLKIPRIVTSTTSSSRTLALVYENSLLMLPQGQGGIEEVEGNGKCSTILQENGKACTDVLELVDLERGDIANTESASKESIIDAKEKSRRNKISRANKGRTPWNKGRTLSEEKKQLIRQRTKEAMQNPEIREKLRFHGKSQTQEVRQRISKALKIRWRNQSNFKQDQESCILQWQDAIAETARVGDPCDEKYEWDSYDIIKNDLQEKWKIERQIQVAKERLMPKTWEHRMRISEAIKAKWSDPDYREKVNKGMHNFPRKTQREKKKRVLAVVSLEQKKSLSETMKEKWNDPEYRRRVIEGTRLARARSPLKNQKTPTEKKKKGASVEEKPEEVGKKHLPTYTDPLVKEKLETVRNMRAVRMAHELKRREAARRAWVLLAEAEKAAQNLEAAAAKDNDVLASLIETRQLLAEAARSIQTAKLAANLNPVDTRDANFISPTPSLSPSPSPTLEGIRNGLAYDIHHASDTDMVSHGVESMVTETNGVLKRWINGRLVPVDSVPT